MGMSFGSRLKLLGTHLRELIIQPIRMLDLVIRPDLTVYVLPEATSGPLSLLYITGLLWMLRR